MSKQASVITDELRAAVGGWSHPRELEVERTAIRKYVEAIQDPNPIYVDDAFARRTPHASIIAPPTFLCTFEDERTLVPAPMPAEFTEVVNGGVEYSYVRPLRLYDRLVAKNRIADVYERDGRLGRMIFVVREEEFFDPQGEFLARNTQTRITYGRPAGDSKPRRPTDVPGVPSVDAKVPTSISIGDKERLHPRYVEDVTVGQILPPLLKKPALRHLVMYAGASGNFAEYHYDPEHARKLGMPGIILHGNLKIAYLGQIVTDWIGVEGTVLKLSAQIRGMDLLGEDCIIKGCVTNAAIESKRGIVEIELWAEAPGARRTVLGNAVAAIPCRDT